MPNEMDDKRPSIRNRLLASATVLGLVVSGTAYEMAISTTSPADAAAVDTSGLQSQAMPSFAQVVERVKPAVVSIKVNMVNAAAKSGDMQDPGQMDSLPPEIQRFFREFGGPNGKMPQAQAQPMVGLGSGFFISADGYIVTNNHVVENAKAATVTTADGKELSAKIIGTDAKSDLAVLKVDEKGDYPFVSFAKQAPKVGDWVVAIGNPYGLGGTVTAGIVSADGRDIGGSPYESYLQIDAPINKGNSGGPTFNMQGQVVGVNTAIFSPSGGSVGIGFAIPASTVESVTDTLEHGGTIQRGFLGITIQPVTQDIADSLGLKSANGAIIEMVKPGLPGAQAGLKSGDVVIALNNEPVRDATDLTRRIGALKPGEKAALSIVRGGAEKTVDVTLASQTGASLTTASATDAQQGPAVLGVELAPGDQASDTGAKGVKIAKVDPNGAAAERGIVAGDVILDVAGKSVTTPQEVKSDIAQAKEAGGKAILMRIKTANGSHFVAFPFPKA